MPGPMRTVQPVRPRRTTGFGRTCSSEMTSSAPSGTAAPTMPVRAPETATLCPAERAASTAAATCSGVVGKWRTSIRSAAMRDSSRRYWA